MNAIDKKVQDKFDQVEKSIKNFSKIFNDFNQR